MKRWVKFLLCGSIVFGLLSACGVVKGLSSAKAAGNAFMAALRDGKNDESYVMLTAELQQEIGGKDAWAQFTAPRNFASWNFDSTSISSGQAQLDGQGKVGSDLYDITLVLQQTSTGWLIAGIHFFPTQ